MSQLNVGNMDRTLRILLGRVLIGLAICGGIGAWGYNLTTKQLDTPDPYVGTYDVPLSSPTGGVLAGYNQQSMGFDMSSYAGSTDPLIGAAERKCGVAASGKWPSPHNRPEVGSSPIQPAPGM